MPESVENFVWKSRIDPKFVKTGGSRKEVWFAAFMDRAVLLKFESMPGDGTKA